MGSESPASTLRVSPLLADYEGSNVGVKLKPRTMVHTQIRDRAYIEGYSLYSQVL